MYNNNNLTTTKKTKRTKVLHARYEMAKDAMGVGTYCGMAIYSCTRDFLGFVPLEHWRTEKIRYIHILRFDGKAMVKLMPTLKRM